MIAVPTEPLLGAIARGWCHPANSHKQMDADLANAIADEVNKWLAAAPAPVDGLVERIRAQMSAANYCALKESPSEHEMRGVIGGLFIVAGEAAAALQSRDEPVAWTDETYDAIWKDFCEWCPEHLRPRLSIMHIREFLKCMKKQIDAATPPRKP